MANVAAMETASIWLDTAEAAMRSKIYATALYSMEMAVEIALKAVLMELGVNVPKLHNIMNVLEAVLDEKHSAISKEFIEKESFILSTYNDLLEIRPIVGYTFETGVSINTEEKAKKYMSAAKEVVGLCRLAVGRTGKR